VFGRNLWNRIVNFDAPAELIGTEVEVEIVRSLNNSHLGELKSDE
jgi:hypothetical protein